MIQDIIPHSFFNQYDSSIRPKADSFVLNFRDGALLILNSPTPAFARLKDFPDWGKDDLIFLFRIDDIDYFLSPDRTGPSAEEGAEYVQPRELVRLGFEKHQVFAGFTAAHLHDWYRNNRFCGRCGEMTFHSREERALKCGCGNIIYPRIVPAVIVGVTNGDSILVTKYRVGYGHYALVAGFTEIGETLEETVRREVMEETGLEVTNIRYYKSQPWGIADDILAGFYCDVVGDDSIHMDKRELKVAEWRKRPDIELQPDDLSLTNEMMKAFKMGLQ